MKDRAMAPKRIRKGFIRDLLVVEVGFSGFIIAKRSGEIKKNPVNNGYDSGRNGNILETKWVRAGCREGHWKGDAGYGILRDENFIFASRLK